MNEESKIKIKKITWELEESEENRKNSMNKKNLWKDAFVLISDKIAIAFPSLRTDCMNIFCTLNFQICNFILPHLSDNVHLLFH